MDPHGPSAIDRFGARQNLATANVVRLASTAARSTRSTGRPSRRSKSSAKPRNRCNAARRRELDQKIGVAAIRIEVGAARGRAEYRRSAHRVAAAQKGDIGAVLFDQVVHGVFGNGWCRRLGRDADPAAGMAAAVWMSPK